MLSGKFETLQELMKSKSEEEYGILYWNESTEGLKRKREEGLGSLYWNCGCHRTTQSQNRSVDAGYKQLLVYITI